MQGDCAVAASGISGLEGGRVGGCRVGVSVPGIGVAGGCRCYTRGAMVQGQMQCDSTVAAHGVGGAIGRRVGRSSVGVAVPSVGVASGLVVDGLATLVDSQMQRYRAVAAHGVGSNKGRRVGRSGVGVAMPCIAVASSGRLNTAAGGTHCEGEPVDTVAAEGGLQAVPYGIGAGGTGDGRCAVTCPCVDCVLADVSSGLAIVCGMHVQRQGEGAVATHLCVHGVVIEGSAHAEGVERERVVGPSKALVNTHILHLSGMVDRVYCEVHGDDTVAPADGKQRVGVGTRGNQLAVAEDVGSALAHILTVYATVGIVLLYAIEGKLFLER